MPLGKSGQYFMNPHEMQRQGDAPPEAAEPIDDVAIDDGEASDGLQHCQIDEMPDGTAHSVHTNADGTKEEEDHASYDEAKASLSGDDAGEDGDGEEAPAAPPMDMGDDSDMAGMYDKAGRK